MDNYPRCATCKHYDPYREGMTAFGFGKCLLISDPGDNPGASVETSDYHDGPLYLSVMDDFGCVLHETQS